MPFDFTAPYNRQNWITFLERSFLPEDYSTSGEEVNLEFKSRYLSRSATYLGSSPTLDLNIYEMHHTSLDDPRISISRDAFRFIEQHKAKNALILFISDKSSNYRLSLITRELQMSGKKVTSIFTNPKRYSYLLGPDIKKHTVEEYLQKKGFEKIQPKFFSNTN